MATPKPISFPTSDKNRPALLVVSWPDCQLWMVPIGTGIVRDAYISEEVDGDAHGGSQGPLDSSDRFGNGEFITVDGIPDAEVPIRFVEADPRRALMIAGSVGTLPYNAQVVGWFHP